jgi:hypothetical protein
MNRNGAEVTLKTAMAVSAEKTKAIMATMGGGVVLPGEDANAERANTEECGHHGEHPVPVEPPQRERSRQQQHPGDEHLHPIVNLRNESNQRQRPAIPGTFAALLPRQGTPGFRRGQTLTRLRESSAGCCRAPSNCPISD